MEKNLEPAKDQTFFTESTQVVVNIGGTYRVWSIIGTLPEGFVCYAPEESLYTSSNERGELYVDDAKLRAYLANQNLSG